MARILGLLLIGFGPAGVAAQTLSTDELPRHVSAPGDAPLWNGENPGGQRPPPRLVVPAQPDGVAPAAVPLSPPSRRPAVPLTSPKHSSPSQQRDGVGGLPTLLTTASSLLLVLGLFLAIAWLMRRTAPRGSVLLPGEVVELLGRAPLASRQQVHLLRCGNKLLLISVTPQGVETLTEITDPDEVDRLAGLCRQAHHQSATAAFRQVLEQFGREPATTGPMGNDGRDERRLADARLPD